MLGRPAAPGPWALGPALGGQVMERTGLAGVMTGLLAVDSNARGDSRPGPNWRRLRHVAGAALARGRSTLCDARTAEAKVRFASPVSVSPIELGAGRVPCWIN